LTLSYPTRYVKATAFPASAAILHEEESRFYTFLFSKKGSKRSLWEEMRALFHTFELQSMTQLFQAILYGFKSQITILAPS